MKEFKKTIEIGGKEITLSTGKLASQASGAVIAQCGETVVLSTVVCSRNDVNIGYFPLTVEYQEKLYAGGRIKGSRWVKREGRATDDEILSGRLIDRSIRPLFPKDYQKEVQVIITVLSVDHVNDPVLLATIATSAALSISDIPWDGPIAAVRMGYVNGEEVVNPTSQELEVSEMDLVVSSTKGAIVMIEAGIKEVTEEVVAKAISKAKSENEKTIKAIAELVKEAGKEKQIVTKKEENEELKKQIKTKLKGQLEKLLSDLALHEGSGSQADEVKKALAQEFSEVDPLQISEIVDKLLKEKSREITLSGSRIDGRKHTQIRKLSAEVGILPRTHGSGLFQRGQTQVLTIATLGARSLGQLIETADGEETKNYIHHYSMPPFATGETGRFGGPSRREIGHGALAERALEPVIPNDDFPYAIRLVSEVLSSNGSTSMASTCASTLALMNAGVPIKSPVSGIAMGVIVEDESNYAILTDIIGLEDHLGDMDFKVAGTEKGITALQLDVKTLKLTDKMLAEALNQAKKARLEILDVMLKAISSPNEKVSQHAPKIEIIKIPVEMIGELIGPGGRNIKKLIADSGAQVEVEDDGTVYVSGIDELSVAKAKKHIEGMTKIPVPNELYEGTVKRIQPFGAFVEILPGKEGLVHVSDMAEEYVEDPNQIVKLGDKVTVRVKEIDSMGRLNLSMKLDPSSDENKPRGPRRGPGGGGGGRRRDNNRDNRDRDNGGKRGGPHFPASRFVSTQDRGKRRFSK